MAIQIIGGSSGTINDVGANKAQFVQPTPLSGGCYSLGFETTSLAFTNNVVVWDLRNPTANLAIVTFVQAGIRSMAIATPATTGLRQTLQLFIGRNYSALSNTNRTAQVLTTNNCKLRTSFPTSGLEIGFASAVGGITGGTITEDATSIANCNTSPQAHSVTAAAAPGAGVQSDSARDLSWMPAPVNGCPIILAQNEGIRLRYLVTTAAAVIIFGQVHWSEPQTTTYP